MHTGPTKRKKNKIWEHTEHKCISSLCTDKPEIVTTKCHNVKKWLPTHSGRNKAISWSTSLTTGCIIMRVICIFQETQDIQAKVIYSTTAQLLLKHSILYTRAWFSLLSWFIVLICAVPFQQLTVRSMTKSSINCTHCNPKILFNNLTAPRDSWAVAMFKCLPRPSHWNIYSTLRYGF